MSLTITGWFSASMIGLKRKVEVTKFVMVFLKNRIVDNVFQIFFIPFGEVKHGLCISHRSIS